MSADNENAQEIINILQSAPLLKQTKILLIKHAYPAATDRILISEGYVCENEWMARTAKNIIKIKTRCFI